jgi:hypothetical protein
VILTLYATVCAICAHCSKCLLYFVNLFHFIEFFVIIEIWTTSHTNNGKQWMKKWYSRYWSLRWDLIEEKTRNFKLVVHETWRRTSCPVVFKIYKKKIWSENHETCRDVMISHGEAVIKIWWGFVKVTIYDAYKLKVLQRGVWFYVKSN